MAHAPKHFADISATVCYYFGTRLQLFYAFDSFSIKTDFLNVSEMPKSFLIKSKDSDTSMETVVELPSAFKVVFPKFQGTENVIFLHILSLPFLLYFILFI